MEDTDYVQYQKANFLIFLLCFIPGTVLSTLAMFFLFPNLNGIGSICISATCGIPLAFSLFFVLQEFKVSEIRVYLFPSLIFPLISLLLIGYSLYEQRPENIFRVFVIDPIPVGVTNIRAHDISAGIDQTIIVTFNATPESIEKIIRYNKLVLVEKSNMVNDPNYQIFDGVEWDSNWKTYEYHSTSSLTTMWISPDGSTVLYRWVSF